MESNNKFISNNNIQLIQQKLKSYFLKSMNVHIQEQSVTEMKIIMKAVQTNYGSNISSKEELNRLNDILLNILKKQIYEGILQYQEYLKYINNPIEPISNGISSRYTDISFNTSRIIEN